MFDCDVAVRGHVDGVERHFFYSRVSQQFEPDRAADPDLTLAQVDQLFAQGRATLTFVGVPTSQGNRIGGDRDLDGTRDGDEGVTPYGAGTAGCNLTVHANSPPAQGNRMFGITTENANPGATGALFIGFGAGSFPIFGIDILIDLNSLFTVSLTADTHGAAVVDMPLGTHPGLQGLTFYVQSVFFDGCGSQGLAASHGVQIVVD